MHAAQVFLDWDKRLSKLETLVTAIYAFSYLQVPDL